MRGDRTSPRHLEHEVVGFKGLLTYLEDARAIPDGFLAQAHNVVFDSQGSVRPRDGSEEWWSALSQRVYLAEFESSESTWAGGTADSALYKYGYQSRYLNATGAMTRTIADALDLYIGGEYNASNTYVNFWVYIDTRANVSALTVEVASDAAFADSELWDISLTTDVTADGAWVLVSKQLGTGTITGTPDYTAIIRLRISATLTGAAQVNVDEVYASYTNYTKSWALGGFEFKKLTDSKRYTIAAFGETLYADLNEARAPYKIKSQLTRNAPCYFESVENRCFIFNGIDDNLVFTGSSVRKAGFPAPTSLTSITDPGGAVTGLTAAQDYYYGYTFVYGEGAVLHGESTVFEFPTAYTATASGQALLSGIEVGAVGVGVVARRVYRCLGGAGASATKYLVGEIADNTTTTYTDAMPDTLARLNAEAPLDNGVPPISLCAAWFEKGMVYVADRALYYSRPGYSLSETPETVPAGNIIPLGASGRVVGVREFNSSLYVFMERGIGKCSWRGRTLEYRAVGRSNEGSDQNVGCHSLRGVTVVGNRYLQWFDTEGQIWKMLPNEEIFRETSNVLNLFDDFNRLPVATSFDYYLVDSQAQWETGTYGGGGSVGSNINDTEVAGQLRYADYANLNASSVHTGYLDTQFNDDALATPSGPSNYWQYSGGNRFIGKLTSLFGCRLRGILIPVHPETTSSGGGVWRASGGWDVIIYRHAPELGEFGEGDLLWQTAGAIDYTGPSSTGADTEIGGDLPASQYVYIPEGESIIVKVKWTAGDSAFLYPYQTFDPYFNNTLGLYNHPAHYYTDAGLYPREAFANERFYFKITGADAVTYEHVVDLDNTDHVNVQRWFSLIYDSLALMGGKSVVAEFEASSDAVTYTARQQIYAASFAAENYPSLAPAITEQRSIYNIPDYRPGEAYPSSPQLAYGRLHVTINPRTHGTTITSQSQSRVSYSSNPRGSFPYIQNPAVTKSRQASWAVSYDRADYASDIWTSEITNAGSIGSFGKLYADFVENQQNIFFQIRTATSSGGIAGATWYDVVPNSVIGSGFVVASATHFQLRIIFQDDSSKQLLDQSYVNAVSVSWAAASVSHAPLLPPVQYYYKDYILGSWPSRDSRTHDRSFALDAYKQTYEDASHRFSTFGAPHYGCYMTVGGKLIGGPISGGKLMRLRNSNNADDSLTTQLGLEGFIETHPMTFGSTNLKILEFIFVGLSLNIHRNGMFYGEIEQYPATPRPYFQAYVAGARISAKHVFDPYAPGAVKAYGSKYLFQVLDFQLPHTGAASSLQPFIEWLSKPYVNEYEFDLGLTEKAFVFGMRMRAVKDLSGIAGLRPEYVYFPSLVNLGFEYFLEHIRGY